MNNTAAASDNRDIWVGQNYGSSSPKILILGESVYGDPPPLVNYIPQWIEKLGDRTFSRLFKNCYRLNVDASTVKPDVRFDFWHEIAFYNFVEKSIGPAGSRAGKIHFSDPRAATALRQVLTKYSPDGVFILGTTQAQYSAPIIEEYGNIIYAKSIHPTGQTKIKGALRNAWCEFELRLKNRSNA